MVHPFWLDVSPFFPVLSNSYVDLRQNKQNKNLKSRSRIEIMRNICLNFEDLYPKYANEKISNVWKLSKKVETCHFITGWFYWSNILFWKLHTSSDQDAETLFTIFVWSAQIREGGDGKYHYRVQIVLLTWWWKVVGTIQKSIIVCRTVHIKLDIFTIKEKRTKGEGGGSGSKIDIIGRTYYLSGTIVYINRVNE